MNPGGMAPVGSIRVAVNSSSPPPADLTPPGYQFDENNPLDFPPLDNSTGTWQRYVPSETPSNLTRELVAADCEFAYKHGAIGYHQTCQSRWNRKAAIEMRITISGTGYVYRHVHTL